MQYLPRVVLDVAVGLKLILEIDVTGYIQWMVIVYLMAPHRIGCLRGFHIT